MYDRPVFPEAVGSLLTQLLVEDSAVRCKLSQPQEGLRVSASCAVSAPQISHTFGVAAAIADAFLMQAVGDAVRCRVHGHATLDCVSHVLKRLTLSFSSSHLNIIY
jgi:hypothetical protein